MNLQSFISTLTGLIANRLIPLMTALALLVFLWGMAQSVWKGNSDKGRQEGKNLAIWGLLALFVMVSVWGLVRVLQQEFNVTNLTL